MVIISSSLSNRCVSVTDFLCFHMGKTINYVIIVNLLARLTYTSSHRVKQTPSRVRISDDMDLVLRRDTISASTFSPNLRHNSEIVRDAV
jgi:hypothetical protein